MSQFSPIHLAVVATGGYAPDQPALERALQHLREAGHQVDCHYDAARRHERFGGDDAGRLAQLRAATDHPRAQVVMALRGGYGTSRLLDLMDFNAMAASGKRFVGHSDFTVLQMGLLATTGACSIAGPMICDDFTRSDRSDYTLEQFWSCLHNDRHVVEWALPEPEAREEGELELEGMLWGGNLTMLAHLVGTRWLPKADGGLLFVEDVNEHPYRVERLLLQLLHAGVLEKQSALLLGDFGQARLTDYDNGYGLSSVIAWLRQRLPKLPIVSGLPFGHVRDKASLVVGARSELRVADGQAQLMMFNPLKL